MKKIILIEEVSPEEVIPEQEAETPWNCPPPFEARYRLAPQSAEIPEEVLKKLKTAYWDEEFLEEADLFFLPPGWRFFGNVPEILKKEGLEVEVVTREELRREKERSRRSIERKQIARRTKEERAKKILERETQGLVYLCTTVPVRFGKKVKEYDNLFDLPGGLDYLRIYQNPKVVERGMGNAVVYWVEPALAQESFRHAFKKQIEHYLSEGDPPVLALAKVGWQAIVHLKYYRRCYGTPLAQYIVENYRDKIIESLKQCVVVAKPDYWCGFDEKEAREVCKELGLKFVLHPELHGIFLKTTFRQPEQQAKGKSRSGQPLKSCGFPSTICR
ncbi:hypothetical protein [Thermosulfurimonas sp. F29]|uniref:hypothetical protein n=1 Tax=Thermosulfurimonas sp. F29 TaxID=2867247 RepID=UPI001C82BFD0|nr:hypothetical protein [Thermosulfurimonas sp. F29]MBX6424174.1 hypothetical protein [Thermosulfurimonas sp. F29]